jgi:hypothetical protein
MAGRAQTTIGGSSELQENHKELQDLKEKTFIL